MGIHVLHTYSAGSMRIATYLCPDSKTNVVTRSEHALAVRHDGRADQRWHNQSIKESRRGAVVIRAHDE